MRKRLLLALIHFFGKLPLPVLAVCGRTIGWLLYRIPNRECRTARINLQLCFPEMTGHERERLLQETLVESAITLMEMPAVWFGDSDTWLKRIDGVAVKREIAELMQQGKGIIFAMPHLGNFELSAHFLGALTTGVGLYRPPRQSLLEAVMVEGRNRPGKNTRMVPANRHGIKAVYEALAANESVVILPDQQPKAARGGVGVYARFFNIPALTMTLVSRFANKTGAPVYFIAFIRCNDKPGYRVIGQKAEPAIGDSDLELATSVLNQGIERLVRQFPAQYQWTYRRFEKQPGEAQSPYKET